MKREELKTKVINLIHYKIGIDKYEILEQSHIRYDLGFDSLDEIEIIMECEKMFNISIPDDDVENIETVEQIINYLQTKIK